jgi:hypothetical protein
MTFSLYPRQEQALTSLGFRWYPSYYSKADERRAKARSQRPPSNGLARKKMSGRIKK